MEAKKEVFSSRWGLILAALGMAVGAGNIWRFPRVAAQNGGGAFLIPWVLFIFLWAIPLLLIEFGIGKATRCGTVGAFGKIMGKKYSWMGAWVGFCTLAITFYYSVVTGWCIKYLIAGIVDGKVGDRSIAYWDSFTSSYQPIIYHFIVMALGSYIIYRGVVRGIEVANKLLIPSLCILLVIGAVRSLTLPGSWEGVNFLFRPDWKLLLNYRVWLEALSQTAWSTGAAWGLILTYAIYTRKREDVVLNTRITVLGDYSASLIAGLAIIPVAFSFLTRGEALEAMASGDTGLAFIWLPKLFSQMPAGNLFMSLFFLALLFAALSSLISQLELVTRIFMDFGIARRRAIVMVGCVSFLLGIPSALSLNFLNNQDWVWGLALMINGFFFAMAAIKYGVSRFRSELINTEGNDIPVGKWFVYVVKYIIPLECVVLLIWWFSQAIRGNPTTWWKPFEVNSVGTCLLQWGLILSIFIIFNRWIAKATLKNTEREPEES
ncbi:MAG: sodium-dependent transporter [Candidatus Aminicenantes bacterium]|nr:sodium-dependent transporter [Candidatus Aminicenantes bacterium]MDH5715113.1 sodium-dependent transporter [Candidatus Aminicenantes bacterium]